jgi:spectinomycin phosphotransferase
MLEKPDRQDQKISADWDNPIALAYYRYERIAQDIAAFCEQLFLTNEGREDREQAFRYLKSNFLPIGVLEIAYRSEQPGKIAEHDYR